MMCVGGPNVRKDYHIDEGEEVINNYFNITTKHGTHKLTEKHAKCCL